MKRILFKIHKIRSRRITQKSRIEIIGKLPVLLGAGRILKGIRINNDNLGS